MTSKRLKGEQLSLIKPPRKGGNPKPKAGRWGVGVQTKTIRVPVEIADKLPDIVMRMSEIIIAYGSRHKETRDWTQANKMLRELEPIIAVLLLGIVRSRSEPPRDRE